MDFVPIIAADLKTTNSVIYNEGLFGLKQMLFSK